MRPLTHFVNILALTSISIAQSTSSIVCNTSISNEQPSQLDTTARIQMASNLTSDADLVIRNASVWTAAEGSSSRATGFAIKNGRFVAVTSLDDDLTPFIGDSTVVHNMNGAPVMPGLFDTHIHHIGGGKMLLKELTFPPTFTLDQILEAVDGWAKNLTEPDAWVTGGIWGSTLLSDISTPEALKRLDDLSHGHPVLLNDDSHHNVWANTLALKAAGVTSPTGVLIEGATSPVRAAQAAAEPDTLDALKSYSLKAWELLHSYGITSIQDAAVTLPQLEAMASLADDGLLKGWISSCLAMHGGFADPNTDAAAFSLAAKPLRRERVRQDFTKLVLDGVPPTRTAGMLEAYLPDHDHGCGYHGLVYNSTSELVSTLRQYQIEGRHTKIHCAGSWSVQLALDAFEIMRMEGSSMTYHIAHGQFVAPADRRRMQALNVVAEVSPFIWYPSVIPSAIASVLPADVASKMQPNRDLLDLGVHVAGGSDWPVAGTPNPWEGIGGLVTRQDPTGQFAGTLWAEQAVSVEEALRIFSISGARAAHLDDVVGSIEVGKAANFIVMDRDPFKVDVAVIGETKVLSTYVAGELVFSRLP